MTDRFDTSLLKSCGEDVLISARAEIRRPQLVSVGSHVAIDAFAYMTTAATLADYVHIGPHVSIIGGAIGELTMGNFCNFAAGARIICVSDQYRGEGLAGPATIPEDLKDEVTAAPIVLEDFVSVGSNAVIMPGVTLAQGTVLGACSMLTKSTDPWTIYAGVPARPVKTRPSATMIAQARSLGYDIAAR